MLYNQLANMYSVNKTIKFELIPQGNTLKNINEQGILEEDKKRAEAFKEVKKILDDYHRQYIEEALSNVYLEGIDEYVKYYTKSNKNSKELKNAAKSLRAQVSGFLTSPEKYKILIEKPNILFNSYLIDFVDGDEEKIALLKHFDKFTTYFLKYHKTRKYIYSKEAKAGTIAYRVIDQNLPKYIDNYKILTIILDDDEIKAQLEEIANEYETILNGKTYEEYFSTDNYSEFLSQEAIDKYNAIICGYTKDENIKIKGINEIINQYNQKHKNEKGKKIGLMKPLFKQILSDRKSMSFLPEQFKTDEEVFECLSDTKMEIADSIKGIQALFSDLNDYNYNDIYINNDGSIETISKNVYNDWSYIKNKLRKEYDETHISKRIKNWEKYIEKREKALKKTKAYTLEHLIELCGDEQIVEYFKDLKSRQSNDPKSIYSVIEEKAEALEKLLSDNYPKNKKLAKDNSSIKLIKEYLDVVKELQRAIKPFNGYEGEAIKDERFYGEYIILAEKIDIIKPVYDKVRNYITRKPYSKEKIKLNFDFPTFMNGWDMNKETANGAILLKKDGYYYLGIINKNNTGIFKDIEESNDLDVYEKMEYKLLPGALKMLPKVFFAEKNRELYNPSDELIEKYKMGTHKEGSRFNLKDRNELIDFFKRSIALNPDWQKFDFHFTETEKYNSIDEFYQEVENQGYRLCFKKIAVKDIDSLVNEGKLFLFKLYNKDFSPYSKGTPNLHTMYWNEIFNEDNLCNAVYRLNGNAEMFFRKSSISPDEAIVHKANEPINNKNKLNKKKTSTFDYDLVKDRRYTMDKFQLHVPITLNANTNGPTNINEHVRKLIRQNKDLNIIGIDRGERNLIYICVIDSKGNIIEQKSLNIIHSDYNDVPHVVDYHALLEEKEKIRDEERKSWSSIENIKELKEGYISMVVHEINKLAVKYNALVVFENLNSGFINSRRKIDKQVYTKIEQKLINKFNFLVDKNTDPKEKGGLLNAFQLTNKYNSLQKIGLQSGAVFFVNAWNTSKIDPVTGFTDLFDTKYKSVAKSKEFWSAFDDIKYDKKLDMFSFTFDYANFTHKGEDTKENWTVYSNDVRIKNKKNKNGNWEQETVVLTSELKKLFEEYSIDYTNDNIINSIVNIDEKDFHVRLLELFRLTMQMRNSKSNSTDPKDDYIISPVMNDEGIFFDSRYADGNLPCDADANGAYNIARKGLILIDHIKQISEEEFTDSDLLIKNKEWLQFAQNVM